MNNFTREQMQILRDAIHEFRCARTPVEHYVATRYASHDDEFRKRKLVEVKQRIDAAQELLNTNFGAE